MATTEIVAPIATYIDAYAVGDRDRLGSVFTDDAYVIYNNMAPSVGVQAIKDSHVQAGRFRYVMERTYTMGDLAVFEGQMYGVKDGKMVESVPIAFAWVVELVDNGQKIKAFRKYYDTRRVAMAQEAMKS